MTIGVAEFAGPLQGASGPWEQRHPYPHARYDGISRASASDQPTAIDRRDFPQAFRDFCATGGGGGCIGGTQSGCPLIVMSGSTGGGGGSRPG